MIIIIISFLKLYDYVPTNPLLNTMFKNLALCKARNI